MKKTIATLCMALAATAASAFEWSFPQGGDPKLKVPHEPALAFPGGFKATVKFSVDLDRISARSNFANLFCKGNDFLDGYCVMVRKDGRVLVDVKGIEPSYYQTSRAVRSNRACTLELYFTPKNVRIFFDGEESGSYAFVGAYDFSNTHRLQIGSMGGYTFPGSLTYLKLQPLSEVTVPPGGPKPMLTELPKRQARAEIRWSKAICKEKGRYLGWPTVLRLKNGDILAAFSGDRDEHVCPWGKVQLIRSTDGGETWSAPETIQNGPIDDRDAGLVQMPDGDIVLTWFTSTAYRTKQFLEKDWPQANPKFWWKRHDEKLSDETRRNALGYFRSVSKDNGRTWSKPERMKAVSHTPHGPILLRDGSLLQLGRSTRNSQLDTGKDYSQSIISAWKSVDKGATWTCLCPEVPDMNGENRQTFVFHEPHAIELPDGTLLGLVRYHGADNCMRQTVSKDGGRTWTPMAKTTMVGLPPHLIRLADGKLVNVYGRRVPDGGYGEFAAISDDNGKTWDTANEICLRPCHNGDLGYPSSCVLPSGDILTVYYHPEKPGEKPCIMATKWRVTK